MSVDDPLLGTEVGRFRLTRLVGKGGMGRVYLGVHPAIGSRVAIKVLAEEYADSPELLERFFTEARAVNLIHHENIVAITDLDRLPGGRPYIVMEYVDGRTLRQLLADAPLPIGGVLDAMIDTLTALDAAHAAGIVHRDLKPDNVILSASGRAKVLDFGIAKLVDRPTTRTATGVSIGTPHYMAPEQILGKACDGTTDVYAAGVMLYELVTGERPFEADNDFQLMEAHMRAPRPSARAKRPAVSEALDAIITKAMAIESADRFASAGALVDALTAAREAGDDPVFTPAQLLPAKTSPEVLAPTPAAAAATRSGETRREVPASRTAPTRDVRLPAQAPRRRWLLVLAGIVAASALTAGIVYALVDGDVPVVAVDAAIPLAIDAPVPIDAAVVPIDAAPPPDAAVSRRSGKVAPIAARFPARTCEGPWHCPQYRCICKKDIRNSQWCRTGHCIGPTESCTELCKDYGGFVGYTVSGPLGDADCAGAPECKRGGRCAMRIDDGSHSCVASCRTTNACKHHGRCTDGPANTCIAGSDADCRASESCSSFGLCAAEGGACVRSAAGCAIAAVCGSEGACGMRDGVCVPRNDADCAASSYCQSDGLCKAGATRCVAATDAGCAASPVCTVYGRCKTNGRFCIATPEGCQASSNCSARGECTVAGEACRRGK